MKRTIKLLMLMFLIGSVLIGCGSTQDTTGDGEVKGKIGVIPKSTLFDYYKLMEAGAKEAGENLGYEITWRGTAQPTDIADQISIVEDFITQQLDAIVISPTDPDALRPVLERAVDSDIPVVILESEIDSDSFPSFIGTDNKAAAALAAEKMIELIGEEGKVAVVSEVPGAIQGGLREDGFIETINKYNDIEFINTFYSDGDRAKASDITMDLFTSNSDIKGIFATNEGSAVGVSLAVESLEMQEDVVVIGFDSSDDQLDAIRNDIIEGAVVQNPFEQGFLGVENAVKLLNGEEVEAIIDTGAVYVEKENMDNDDVQKILFP